MAPVGEDLSRHYSDALDEIYRLRRALAYEAAVLEIHIHFKSFPKSRRQVAESQIDRMRASARGEADLAYVNQETWALRSAMEDAGARQTLTRHEFEAERA